MRIQDYIGETPIVALNNLPLPPGIRLFAKIEYMNPSGSIKDRIARYILDDAERRGRLRPGSTIIENTSGNTGAAIAMLAAARGYRAILTMPDKVSREKQSALKALGADIIVCPTGAAPESEDHYVTVARRLHAATPGSFMLNQYDNPLNAEAHFQTTGPEIWKALGRSLSVFVASGSTGGTISGTARYLKSRNRDVRAVFLDPVGSIYHGYFHNGVVDPNDIALYHVEGVGEDHIAKCMDFSVVSDVIRFEDRAAFATCRLLAEKEGLLCGGSSGANVWGCLEVAKTLRAPAVIATVLPDSGVKYMSKIYDDDWLRSHGLLEPPVKTEAPLPEPMPEAALSLA